MSANRTLWSWIALITVAALGLAACAPADLPAPAPTYTSAPTLAPTKPAAPQPTQAAPATPGKTNNDTSSSSDDYTGGGGSQDYTGGGGNTPPATVLDQAQVVPQPGEKDLDHGPVFLDTSEVLTLESAPPQLRLHLVGSLPDPCHALRVAIGVPDARKRIQIEVYSVVQNPDLMCAQVLVPFEVTVPLQGLQAGDYQVLVNDQDLGTVTQ